MQMAQKQAQLSGVSVRDGSTVPQPIRSSLLYTKHQYLLSIDNACKHVGLFVDMSLGDKARARAGTSETRKWGNVKRHLHDRRMV